jgi:hypothetical protein
MRLLSNAQDARLRAGIRFDAEVVTIQVFMTISM